MGPHLYYTIPMYLEQDHLVQNEYFMIGRQKVVVFRVYIIVPNVNNILEENPCLDIFCLFYSTAAR